MTYDGLLRRSLTRAFQKGKEAEATKLLLMETSGLGAALFYASLKDEVPDGTVVLFESRFRQYLEDDIPIQQLLGHAWFYGYRFIVTPDVLIPRAETEGLVAQVLMTIDDMDSKAIKVLDLGSGSGCIGLTIKKEAPEVDVTLADVSAKALEVAKENALALDTKVTFVESDLFANIDGRFGIIVSNPPYIPDNEILDPLVEKDPALALYGGADGLSFYRRIISESRPYLEERAVIAFEHGYDQAERIVRIALDVFPAATVRTYKDFSGKDRVTMMMIGGSGS